MLSNGRTEKNAAAILHAMADVNTISQAQLMPLVHLKRTSIFNVMEQMHRAKLVRPCGNFSGGKGRGTILWTLNEDAGRLWWRILATSIITTASSIFRGICCSAPIDPTA